jgi:hypothetical protein
MMSVLGIGPLEMVHRYTFQGHMHRVLDRSRRDGILTVRLSIPCSLSA